MFCFFSPLLKMFISPSMCGSASSLREMQRSILKIIKLGYHVLLQPLFLSTSRSIKDRSFTVSFTQRLTCLLLPKKKDLAILAGRSLLLSFSPNQHGKFQCLGTRRLPYAQRIEKNEWKCRALMFCAALTSSTNLREYICKA